MQTEHPVYHTGWMMGVHLQSCSEAAWFGVLWGAVGCLGVVPLAAGVQPHGAGQPEPWRWSRLQWAAPLHPSSFHQPPLTPFPMCPAVLLCAPGGQGKVPRGAHAVAAVGSQSPQQPPARGEPQGGDEPCSAGCGRAARCSAQAVAALAVPGARRGAGCATAQGSDIPGAGVPGPGNVLHIQQVWVCFADQGP